MRLYVGSVAVKVTAKTPLGGGHSEPGCCLLKDGAGSSQSPYIHTGMNSKGKGLNGRNAFRVLS